MAERVDADALARRLAELSPEARARLRAKLGRASQGGPAGIPQAPRDRPLPLGLDQERLWFTEQQHPGRDVYHISEGLRLYGPLDVEVLKAAFAEIVRRHEIMRTTIAVVDDQPVQVILDEQRLDFTEIDLREVLDGERRVALETAVRRHVRLPFDLARGPVLRLLLARVADEEHVLVETMHHAMTDHWSTGRLNEELAALYRAFVAGQPSPLPELRIQFADYAVWQRDWLTGAVRDRHLGYWREQLRGAPDLLDLPLDRPRRPDQDFAGVRHFFAVPKDTSRGFAALTRAAGVTPFTTMLAAYAVMLGRYSGRDDVVIGAPAATRTRPETHPLIGFLLTNLPIRIDLSGNPTFEELIRRTQLAVRGANVHGEVPFGLIVDALRPPRALTHTPYLQTFLIFLYFDQVGFDMGPVRGLPTEVDDWTAPVELTLTCWSRGEHLHGRFEYRTALFDAATIDRMAGHLGVVLGGVVRDPSVPVRRVAVLTDAERRRLIAVPGPVASAAAVTERIVATARGRGAAAAVVCGERRVSFAEVERRSAALAARLVAAGVTAERRVGVCVERSAELVIALLGVLRSGAAFVPLDPVYPQARLAAMAADAGVGHVVAGAGLRGRGRLLAEAVLAVDGEASAGVDLPRCAERGLAYVIYTSGSTGRPKGVMVEHGSLSRFFAAIDALVGDRAPAVWRAVTSVGFDISILELLWTLASGRTIELVEDALAGLDGGRARALQCTPSLAKLLVADDRGRALLGRLELMMVGGEALPEALAAELVELCEEVVNVYGPTETTIWSTADRVDDEAVTIGRALAGERCYVVDRGGELVAQGIAGELWIGGEGVARGYLGQPGLTAERFVPDPWGPPGARAYRTGDRVRRLLDGRLAFHGRLDDQLKISGHRIEPGEIEALLAEHPAVGRAAVVVARTASGEPALAAHVVAAPGREVSATELRAFLADRLPAAALPVLFAARDALPLLPSGKLDRKTLEAETSIAEDRAGAPPSTPTEQTLAELWSDVLGVEVASVDQNFFAAGGNSLATLRLVTAAGRRGVTLTPRQVFEGQTIRELAAVVTHDDRSPSAAEEPPGPVPLAPSQRGFLELPISEPHLWSHAFALAVVGDADAERLAAALDAVARLHPALRLRVERDDASWSQRLAPPGQGAELVELDLAGVGDHELSDAVEHTVRDLQRAIRLDSPLLRAALLRCGPGRPDRVAIAVHHLAFDGVSASVLLDDLATAYSAGADALAPPSVSFPAFARALEAAAPAIVDSERRFWRRQAPRDAPRGDRGTYGAAERGTWRLGPEETTQLRRDFVAATSFRIDEVLLCAVARAWGRCWREADVVVDVAATGREGWSGPGDLWRTVGWLATFFPLRLSTGGEAPPLQALRGVADRVRAVPGGGSHAELVRQHLAAEHGDVAVPELSFNYLGALPHAGGPRGGAFGGVESFSVLGNRAAPRLYALELEALLEPDGLAITLTWDPARYGADAIARLATGAIDEVRTLLWAQLSVGRRLHAGDPAARGLSHAEIDAINDRLARERGALSA